MEIRTSLWRSKGLEVIFVPLFTGSLEVQASLSTGSGILILYPRVLWWFCIFTRRMRIKVLEQAYQDAFVFNSDAR